MARRRIVPVPVPARGPGMSATDQPGPATAWAFQALLRQAGITC